MPDELHEKMVSASKRATPIPLSVGTDIIKVTNKPQPRRIPDLFNTNEIAIEVLNFPNGGRLDKFGYTYKNLVLVIPVPDNVTDVWIYDEANDEIIEKFRRDADKVRKPRITLTCFKCDYTWTPRAAHEPKMCPQCKNRDWNTRLTSSVDNLRAKQERIARLGKQ